MKKIALLLSLSSLMMVTSCSKEQRTVNQLDGEWKATKVETTTMGFSQTQPYDGELIFKFNKCKVNDGYCDGSVVDNGQASNFTYTVEDEGDKILIKYGTGDDYNVTMEKIDNKTRKITFSSLDFISQTIDFSSSFIPEEFQDDFNEDTNEFEDEMSGFEDLFNIKIAFILEKQ